MLTGAQAPAAGVAEHVREALFTPSRGAPRMGAEVEWLVLDAETRAPVSLHDRLVPFLRTHGASRGWAFRETEKGPRAVLPNGGAVAMEPGGQLEYASPPLVTPGLLIADVQAVTTPLRRAARAAGIDLLGVGIDPYNPLEATPLQILADRYRGMDAYFASIGVAGQRMMRQTAALQINVDPRHEVDATWRVLNALAPVLVAAFANSRMHAGHDTGCISFRAETWRHADPTRTGLLPCVGPAAEEYASFALCARAMFLDAERAHPPYRDCSPLEAATGAAFATHLTTLFPEIRPRRHMEVRSVDAQAEEWLAVPMLFVAAIVSDATALAEAAELLGDPDPEKLVTAGHSGLSDAWLRATTLDLFRIAADACGRMGPDWYGRGNLAVLEAFGERFVESRPTV